MKTLTIVLLVISNGLTMYALHQAKKISPEVVALERELTDTCYALNLLKERVRIENEHKN